MHPLTIEDILHQDPREKTDVFDSLGYYFVVFRALDDDSTHKSDDEVEGVNVYMAVFREGIVTVRPAFLASLSPPSRSRRPPRAYAVPFQAGGPAL